MPAKIAEAKEKTKVNLDLIAIFKRIRNSQLILWPLLTLAIILISLFALTLPRINSFGKINREIAKNKTQIKDIKNKQTLLMSLDEQKAMEQFALTVEALPEKNDPSFFLAALTAIAAENEYTIDKFDLRVGSGESDSSGSKKASLPGKATELNIEAELSGPNERVDQLLSLFLNSLPIFEVKNFSVNSVRGEGRVKTSLVAFYTPELVGLADTEKIQLKDLVLDAQETELLSKLEVYRRIGKDIGTSIPNESFSGRENPFSF